MFGRGVPVLVVAKCAEPADCRGDAVCTESPSEGAGVYFGRGTCEWRIVVGESQREASRSSSRLTWVRVLCTSGELRLARAERKLVEYLGRGGQTWRVKVSGT